MFDHMKQGKVVMGDHSYIVTTQLCVLLVPVVRFHELFNSLSQSDKDTKICIIFKYYVPLLYKLNNNGNLPRKAHKKNHGKYYNTTSNKTTQSKRKNTQGNMYLQEILARTDNIPNHSSR